MLPAMIHGVLREAMCTTLTELILFFRSLCSKIKIDQIINFYPPFNLAPQVPICLITPHKLQEIIDYCLPINLAIKLDEKLFRLSKMRFQDKIRNNNNK